MRTKVYLHILVSHDFNKCTLHDSNSNSFILVTYMLKTLVSHVRNDGQISSCYTRKYK